MKNKIYKTNPSPNALTGLSLLQSWAIGTLLLWIIEAILKGLLYPIRYLFMTNKQIYEEELSIAKEKIQKRKFRYLEKNQPSDPLKEYNKRFITNTIAYRNNPENKIYEEWHENWKKGTIADPLLQWAPTIYEEEMYQKEKVISKQFLDYLENQVQNFWNKTLKNTLNTYYPEFTPNKQIILKEIQELQNKYKNASIFWELKKEILKQGIPENTAENLIKETKNGTELKECINIIQQCKSLGYKIECGYLLAMFHIDHDKIMYKWDPNANANQLWVRFLNISLLTLQSKDLTRALFLLIFKNKICFEGFISTLTRYAEKCKNHGIFSPNTFTEILKSETNKQGTTITPSVFELLKKESERLSEILRTHR